MALANGRNRLAPTASQAIGTLAGLNPQECRKTLYQQGFGDISMV